MNARSLMRYLVQMYKDFHSLKEDWDILVEDCEENEEYYFEVLPQFERRYKLSLDILLKEDIL